MSRITGTETLSLMEAYRAVYSSQQSLEEEIFESIAYALISQGYTATDVLEYFANVDEEVIIEDIVSIAEGTLLIEEVVAEEYLQEQYEILSEALPAIAAGLGLAGRALLGAGARRTAGAVIKRMAGPGVRKAVGGVVKNIGGAVSKVKDLAKGALNKLPGGSGGKLASGLKTAGKWALGGAAFEAGAKGVKALMGDKGSSAKTAPSGDKAKYNASAALGGQAAFKAGGGAAKMKQNPKMSAADVQKLGMKNIKNKPTPTPAAPSSTPTPAASSTPAPSSTPAKQKVAPTKPTQTQDNKLTNMQKWAKANPTLAAKVKPGQSGYDDISAKRDKPGPNEKQDQTPTQGNPEAKIDPKAVGDALKAQQERDKNKAKPQTVNASYEYDAYDLVLEYLLSQGHTDTVEEAHYVMMEMDAETIGTIVEAAADQSDKQIDKGVKTTYKAQNVLDNQHQDRSKGLNKLPRGEREEKAKRMGGRLKSRRDDLFGERNKREDSKREQLKKMLGL
jgi:hypothetical protein